MTLITRKRYMAAKTEATEGTVETLTSTEAVFQLYEQTADFEVQMFQRNPQKPSLSKLVSVVGTKASRFRFRQELRGSGSISTAPSWGVLLKACGFDQSAINSVTTTGAGITNTINHGATITGGTSGATGRVIGRYTGSGAKTIYYKVLTSNFSSGEALTSNDSPAGSCTMSGALTANVGFEWKPNSGPTAGVGGETITIGLYEEDSPSGSNTLRKLMRGARGTARIMHKVGEPVFIEFEFLGVHSSIADTTKLTQTIETTIPAAYLASAAVLGSFSPIFSSLDIDVGNQLSPRLSANDASGILSVRITDRNPTGSMDPEGALVANKDWFGDWFAPNTSYFEETIGTAAGNKFKVYAPAFQIESISDGNREDLSLAQLSIAFKSDGGAKQEDNELALVMI